MPSSCTGLKYGMLEGAPVIAVSGNWAGSYAFVGVRNIVSDCTLTGVCVDASGETPRDAGTEWLLVVGGFEATFGPQPDTEKAAAVAIRSSTPIVAVRFIWDSPISAYGT